MTRITLAALAVVGLFGTATAYADDSFQPGVYAGIEAGAYAVRNQVGILSQTLVNTVGGGTASATQKASVATGRILIGYKLYETTDLELGYSADSANTANFTGVSGSAVSYTGSVGVKTATVDYSALFRPSLSSGANGFFVRVGVHSDRITGTNTITVGSTAYAYSAAAQGNGGLFGIGYDGKIANKTSLRLQAMQYQRVAGTSASASVLSVGVIQKF